MSGFVPQPDLLACSYWAKRAKDLTNSLEPPNIGLLNEKPLHAALKQWYAQPGDEIEVKVDGYFVDIVQKMHGVREPGARCGPDSGGDSQDILLVEIQTRNFSAIKRKLTDLVERYPLRLVYPIAQEKWIIKRPRGDGEPATRRKSPKRGRPVDIFRELVYISELMNVPNFSLEVLLVQEEEVRCYHPRKGWRRRGWITEERHLLAVLERHLFRGGNDLWRLIPDDLPEEFTTADLTHLMKIPKRTAGQMAYCLRKMNLIEQIGKRGRSYLYLRKA